MKKKTVVSLFAGAGGFDLGFAQAGFNVKVAVENNPYCCATLRHNFPDKIVIQKNIEEVTPEEICKLGRLRPVKIAAVIGGPPCQGFSQLGKKDPNDPRNFMFKEYFRITAGLSPQMFLMENTAALFFPRNQNVLTQILAMANDIGYAASPIKLNAADYGIPQYRHRCFIFGRKLPSLDRFTEGVKTVKDAIADLQKKKVTING